MPDILLTFLDGEVFPAEAPLVDFTQPVLTVTSKEPGGNNRELIVPLSSVKYIVFGGDEADPEPDLDTGKVVIHFVDHEVLRAYAGRQTLGGAYGVIYNLVDPERRVRRRLGVPYTAVKAIFKVKTWDSRGQEPEQTFSQVVRILSGRDLVARTERAGKTAARLRKQPLLDRTHSE
ncbi:MAG TPA: hypothetical protein VIN56_05485 [Candidatus Dormibacteraeota bacterium]